MAKRKAIPKRVRFEVFKRDTFACQYCGRTPPAVVLELDHVVPVAGGGDDDPDNLVTACEDCNSGKSDRSLQQVPPTLQQKAEKQQELADQLAAYNAMRMEQRALRTAEVEAVGAYWFESLYGEDRGFVFGYQRERSVRRFLDFLSKVDLLDAVDIAFGRMQPASDYDDKTFRYFCGICWKKIRANQGEGDG